MGQAEFAGPITGADLCVGFLGERVILNAQETLETGKPEPQPEGQFIRVDGRQSAQIIHNAGDFRC